MCCNGCLPICVLPMPNVRPAQSGKRTSAAEGRPQIMRRDSRLALRSIGGQWDWRLRCIRTVHGKRFIFAPTPVLFYRKRQAGAWSQAISVYHDTERRAILKRNDYTRAAVVSQPPLFLCDINSLIKEVQEYMYVKTHSPSTPRKAHQQWQDLSYCLNRNRLHNATVRQFYPAEPLPHFGTLADHNPHSLGCDPRLFFVY